MRMQAFVLSVAICFTLNTACAVQPVSEKFSFELSTANHFITGYAKITKIGGQNLNGVMCPDFAADLKDDKLLHPKRPLTLNEGTIKFSGKFRSDNEIKIVFERPPLGLPKSVKLKKSGSGPAVGFHATEESHMYSYEKRSTSLNLTPFSGSDTSYKLSHPLSDGSFDDTKFDVQVKVNGKWKDSLVEMSELASLQKDSVLQFMQDHIPVGEFAPETVKLLVNPDKIDSLKSYIDRELLVEGVTISKVDAIPFGESIVEELCQPPIIEMELDVPANFEHYYAARLQKSGLVVTAYPEWLGLDPMNVSISVPPQYPLFATYMNSSIALRDRDASIEKFLSNAIEEFISLRRPKNESKSLFTITRKGPAKSDLASSFRFSIVGPSLSQCERGIWEKVEVLLIPRLVVGEGNRPSFEILMQMLSGNFAPGALIADQTPPDSRFNDNSLSDKNLDNWQSKLLNIFNKLGFPADTNDPSQVANVVERCSA